MGDIITVKEYVMVVEDDNLLLKAILKTFDLQGFVARGFLSGTEALRFMEDERLLPKLIWLDYMLKDTNGRVFMKLLNEKPQWTNIPVVVVTGSVKDHGAKDLLDLGVKDLFYKDKHSIEDIVTSVKKLLT